MSATKIIYNKGVRVNRLLVKSACFIPEGLEKDLLHCI